MYIHMCVCVCVNLRECGCHVVDVFQCSSLFWGRVDLLKLLLLFK